MILVKHNKFKHPLWGIIYGIRYFHEAEDARDKARSRVFVVVCRYTPSTVVGGIIIILLKVVAIHFLSCLRI